MPLESSLGCLVVIGSGGVLEKRGLGSINYLKGSFRVANQN